MYRIVGGAALFLTPIWYFLVSIGIIAAVIWMLVDAVVFQLVLGREGWTSNSGGNLLLRLFYWPFDMAEWTFFGTGSFPWLP